MSKIIVTRGLPASGKSTWAKAWVAADPGNRVRVNRDGIRWTQGIRTGIGTPEQENLVTLIEESIVKAAVAKGKDVVVDAMHLKASYVKRWTRFGAEVEVKDFPVPIDTLLDRDIHRIEAGERGVGHAVILDLAQRFGIKPHGALPKLPTLYYGHVFRPYTPGEIPAYSFDIDGTLARMVDRGPYDTSRYDTDVADNNVVRTLWALQDGSPVNTKFLILSGRSDEFRDVLEEWLNGWGIWIEPELIFMRKAGDLRNDAIVKSEIVDEHISGVYDVIMHFDDRNRVVDALRAKGMKVAQVEPGDF
jgi:predicted kinase